MKRETVEFINKNHMLHPGDRVVVGVSGGADSVCLLHLLWCLREELQIELRAVHVHHGLRGDEADRDAQFTKSLCEKFFVPCEVVKIHADEEAREQGISVEEAGRNARYRILEEKAVCWEKKSVVRENKTVEGEGGGDISPVKIAVAHHGDDSAETILHNLCRGSGLKGLSGIPPIRGRIIRPILWVSRKEIIDYLKSENLTYAEDSTNRANDYTRNKIRNRILPLIAAEVNEQAVKNILRAGELLSGANLYFEKMACEWLERFSPLWEPHPTVEHPTVELPILELPILELPIAELQKEETLIQGYILREAFKKMDCPLKDVTGKHIEEILSLLSKQTGKRVELAHGISAERRYKHLRLSWGEVQPKIPEEVLPTVNMKIFPYNKQEKILKNQYTKWFDYDKIRDALSVRHRQTGDFIMLPGGKRKTVKAYMIDEKISADRRAGIPLLAEGGHVLWIMGYRISEYYKVTDDTKNILEVQLDGGNKRGRQD